MINAADAAGVESGVDMGNPVIHADVMFVDGDRVTMVFFTWASLWAWTEHNAGKYCGIFAHEVSVEVLKDEKGPDEYR